MHGPSQGILQITRNFFTSFKYNSLFAKWADWCQQRDRNPTAGPIEDVVNFLAKEGYKYCSVNVYRSAISSVHAKVDGQPVGQHPLISRVLKGAFNERPPLPRYSTFWDVGVVLRYLKDQGANKELSLHSLTLKAAILFWLLPDPQDQLTLASWTSVAEPSLQRACCLSLNICPSKVDHPSHWLTLFSPYFERTRPFALLSQFRIVRRELLSSVYLRQAKIKENYCLSFLDWKARPSYQQDYC